MNFGGVWHSDTAYLDVPPMASMLIARQIPPYGGDTLFANMYLAYETLSDGMKALVESCEKRGALAGKLVLDVGCNDGSLLDFFKAKGARTVGIEPTGAYSDALDPQVAAGELRGNAGSQFDPMVVDAALAVLTREQPPTIALTRG